MGRLDFYMHACYALHMAENDEEVPKIQHIIGPKSAQIHPLSYSECTEEEEEWMYQAMIAAGIKLDPWQVRVYRWWRGK